MNSAANAKKCPVGSFFCGHFQPWIPPPPSSRGRADCIIAIFIALFWSILLGLVWYKKYRRYKYALKPFCQRYRYKQEIKQEKREAILWNIAKLAVTTNTVLQGTLQYQIHRQYKRIVLSKCSEIYLQLSKKTNVTVSPNGNGFYKPPL